MSIGLEVKKRKKREPAKYFVVVNDSQAITSFPTHKSAIKFINERLNPKEYNLVEGDVIKVVKQIEKTMSTHSIKPIVLLSVTQLSNDII